MSIVPQPFEPAIFRNDPNETTSELVNKIQAIEQADSNRQQAKKRTCMKTYWEQAHHIVENINFQIFITVFTVGSLFMEDIRVIFLDMSSDGAVDIINIIFIVIFMAEIILNLSIPNYFCSFFFFLDIVSTLSIMMDISMLTNYFSQSGTLGSGIQLSTIIRNSKASRAAARTVRVMKIFRLARIVKLYKSATKAKQLKSKRIKQQIQQRIQRMRQKKKKQVQKQQQVLISYRNIQSQGGSRPQIGQSKNKISKHATIRPSNNKIINMEPKLDTKQPTEQPSCQQPKLQPQQQEQEQKQKQNNRISIDSTDADNFQQLQEQFSKKQSKISKLLSDSTMKKIILVILLIMFSVPVLDIDNYYQQVTAWDFLADFVAIALTKPQIPIQKINLLIKRTLHDESNLQDTNQQLILFKTPFQQLYSYNSSTFSQQRINDLLISQQDINIDYIIQARNGTLSISQQNQNQTLNKITIIFSCKVFNQIDSWFSIGKIIFICVGIVYLLHVFNQSITQMITEPIQKMLQDVKNNGKEDYIQQAHNNIDNPNKKTSQITNYETTNIHYALNKISHLISKFFGIRGKQFIYRRIFQPGTITANYLSESKKVYCMLALCTIDNYCHISNILKEDIIQLNNQVAEYLHSAAFRYGGTGLVNRQGSFLVVFQCPSEYEGLIKDKQHKGGVKKYKQFKNYNIRMEKSMRNINKILKPRYRRGSQFNTLQNDEKSVKIAKLQNNYLNIMADFSIYAMVKTLVKIHKEAKFYKYKKDARLVSQLGDNFQININCMLHAGWIHQGFIGSNLKMNFSYYGQIVEEVQRLAYHSRNFVGRILLSNNVYDLITTGMKRYTRIVDRYINKSNQQQSLYVVDLNLQNISPPKNIFDKKHRDPAVISLKKILNFQTLKDEQQIKSYKAETFINSKKQLRQVMKNVISQQFRRKYCLAFQHYTFGQISQCKQILDQLYSFNKDDFLVHMLISKIQSITKTDNKSRNNLEDIFQFI